VIASSGAYGSRAVPTGVLADAFYAKGDGHPEALLNSVAALIETSAEQARAHQSALRRFGFHGTGKTRMEYLIS
jgi:hypothetical protein